MQVGTVVELWRYPVKSVGGEPLAHAPAGPRGIEGDRIRALVDDSTGKVLSAKTVPRLLEAVARYVPDGEPTITADGDVSLAGPAALSAWLGRAVHLAAPVEGVRAVFDMDVDAEAPGDTVELRTPPGSFFDSRSTLHLVSQASLGPHDARRFRPNLVVATDAGAAPSHPEDEWVGHTLRIGGEGGIEAVVRKRTGRCVLITRPQPGLPRDLDVYRELLRTRDGDLGVYLDPVTDGRLSVGDAVELLA
jgi:uncharacterized protein YcbX